MDKYFKQNKAHEEALLNDLNTLIKRSSKGRLFEEKNQKDFSEEKTELIKLYNASSKGKRKKLEPELKKLNKLIEEYTHMWVLQITPGNNVKTKKKVLTITYSARKDGSVKVEIFPEKILSNVGKAGVGTLLLFGGPLGWLVGGTLGTTGLVGVKSNYNKYKEIHDLIEKHLEEDDMQSL